MGQESERRRGKKGRTEKKDGQVRAAGGAKKKKSTRKKEAVCKAPAFIRGGRSKRRSSQCVSLVFSCSARAKNSLIDC